MKNILLLFCLAAISCMPAAARTRPRVRRRTAPFIATAFVRGPTASGIRAQRGVVAADTRLLPKGTLIRVGNAGPYSGTYLVADKGPAIRGRRIDIFVTSPEEARQFGRRVVTVEVLRRGAVGG